jgi:hypothetical protein
MMTKRLFVEKHLSKSMMIIVLWAGLLGIALQFNNSIKDNAIWVGLAVFGGLVVGGRKFDERERQLLSHAYSLTLQWLAIALLAAYAFLQVSEWLDIAGNIASFLNSHWIGMTVSVICVFLGGAGLRLFREE